MRDVIVLAIIAAFFALCVAYVRWCDRIIGPDPDVDRDDDADDVAEPTDRRRRRRRRGGAVVIAAAVDNWIGLGIAVLAGDLPRARPRVPGEVLT